MKLEDLKPNATVQGVLPNSLVTVISVKWLGTEGLEVTYKTPTGKLDQDLFFRDDES